MARDVAVNIIGRDLASPAFARAGAAADGAAARMNAAANRMVIAGKKMTHAVTLPLLGVAAVSAKMATDFNSAMTKVQTQAGASAKDVQVLSTQVLALAKYAQQGPTELANSLYHLKSVGMDNVAAMKALRVASDFAAVGGANLEETTNALAGAWRTGIKGATDMGKAAGTLNAIIGAGNMRMEDLTAALGTGILPTAKTFGLTLKDVGAALALFTDEGVPADAAATRLRMTMSLLGAPSKAAEKQLRSIGVTGLRLAEDMRKPNGLVVAVTDLKQHLDDSGLSASKQAQLLSRAFGGGRSSSAILSMVNNLDVLRQKQDQVTASMKKFDAAVKTQRATPEAKFKLMVSSLQRSAIIIGNAVLPSLIKLADWVGRVAEDFNGLSKSQKNMILVAGLVLAALGPVLRILGNLTKAVLFLYRTGALMVRWAAAMVLSFGRVIAGARRAEISMAGMQSRSYTAGLAMRRNAAMMGTAVGVVTAAVLLGVKAWSDYRAKQEKQKEVTDELTAAIERDSGALGRNTREAVANRLEQTGALKIAQKYGVYLPDLIRASLGSADATARLKTQFDALRQSGKLSNSEWLSLITSIGGLAIATKNGQDAAERHAAALSATANAANVAAQAAASAALRVDGLGAAISNLPSEKTIVIRTVLITEEYKARAGGSPGGYTYNAQVPSFTGGNPTGGTSSKAANDALARAQAAARAAGRAATSGLGGGGPRRWRWWRRVVLVRSVGRRERPPSRSRRIRRPRPIHHRHRHRDPLRDAATTRRRSQSRRRPAAAVHPAPRGKATHRHADEADRCAGPVDESAGRLQGGAAATQRRVQRVAGRDHRHVRHHHRRRRRPGVQRPCRRSRVGRVDPREPEHAAGER